MLNLTGVSLLQYSRRNEFFGDTIRYTTRDELSIQGSILDLANTSGCAGVLAQLSGINTNQNVDWDFLTLNNQYFGLARINSINYLVGNDVKIKQYQINVTIFQSGFAGNLNVNESLYSGINLSSPLFPVYLIDQFSEDFSTSISENGDYTEQQNIKVVFNSGAAIGTNQSPISMSQQWISNLINSNPVVGFVDAAHSGYRLKPGRRQRQESINLISNEYSVTETFKLLADFQESYAFSYVNSIQLNEAGQILVREQGKVQGLIPNYYSSAISGMHYEVENNSFNRCNSLFNSFGPVGSYPLSSKRLVYGQTLNKYIDTVNYEVQYSNDPKIVDNYSWEYTQEIQRNNNCDYTISENGSVIGISAECAGADRYNNASAGFITVKAGIAGRTLTFYQDFSNFTSSLKLIEKSESRSKTQGFIKYNYVFSDNLLYSTAGVKKLSLTINDEYAVPGKNVFQIANYKEIVQKNNIMTLSKRQIQVEMNGFRNTVLADYLALAITTLNNNIPAGTDVYLENCQYQINRFNNQFSISADYIFQENINLNQFLLS